MSIGKFSQVEQASFLFQQYPPFFQNLARYCIPAMRSRPVSPTDLFITRNTPSLASYSFLTTREFGLLFVKDCIYCKYNVTMLIGLRESVGEGKLHPAQFIGRVKAQFNSNIFLMFC